MPKKVDANQSEIVDALRDVGAVCQRALKVELDIPPSANNAYFNLPRGGRAMTMQGRRYKVISESSIIAATALQGFYVLPEDRFSLSIYLSFPNKKRRDISNCVKLIEDALSNAIGFDDKRVDVLHVERKMFVIGNPVCEVVLSVIEGN